jgi:hypothetical protein
MHSNARYLGLGLGIGIAAAAVVFGSILVFGGPTLLIGGSAEAAPAGPPNLDLTLAALPTSTASSTPMRLPTATVVRLPTTTPFPTQTPDALLVAINTGKLIFSGPLSYDLQVHLYAASLKYAQTTVKDSIRMSKVINGVGYGDPSNICGPLAIAILRDGGVIPADTDPHEFWLLDPNTTQDERKLEQVFPPVLYARTRILTAINKVDWKADPLEPGDFVFIWHGSGGNFDHMLVVSRVDKNHRAYAVTNFGTPDGYMIAETVLYDPNDPTQGIFHTWTQQRDAILGSTGFGGYELWRLRTP